jgi:predicted DCC family thiol-disulfide oxidoreductase YuxK
MDNGHMSGVLFFDGACGMCTRSRDLLLRLNRTGDLSTEATMRALAHLAAGKSSTTITVMVTATMMARLGDQSTATPAINERDR